MKPKYSVVFCRFWFFLIFILQIFESSFAVSVVGGHSCCPVVEACCYHPTFCQCLNKEYNQSELTLNMDDIHQTTERVNITVNNYVEEAREKSYESVGQVITSNFGRVLCDKMDPDIQADPPKFIFAKVRNSGLGSDSPAKDDDPGCWKWVMVPCEGTDRHGMLDANCLFWMPIKDITLPSCPVNWTEKRRKRATQEIVRINGLDAASLCTAMKTFDSTFKFNTVVLKTNEISDLICTTWILSQAGEWEKAKEIPKKQCENMNKFRHFEVAKRLTIDDNEDIRCGVQGGMVSCRFL